jgi:hypothetical protein
MTTEADKSCPNFAVCDGFHGDDCAAVGAEEGSLDSLAADLLKCALAREPNVRILGNLRADEIVRLARFALNWLAEPETCEHSGCGGTISHLVCDRCRSY